MPVLLTNSLISQNLNNKLLVTFKQVCCILSAILSRKRLILVLEVSSSELTNDKLFIFVVHHGRFQKCLSYLSSHTSTKTSCNASFDFQLSMFTKTNNVNSSPPTFLICGNLFKSYFYYTAASITPRAVSRSFHLSSLLFLPDFSMFSRS